ncbi:uncharacterized protein LOC133344667 isoform X1 [Lethenteron reissneri]|uniref:uncharacterized protein LOC133344667 isoform X1 n=2 Tax=Lethenteron reissneri TaxID=7753 RepID=UPI002AB6CAD2|nr:uncharacterized protein LOC133344667 isoform X1 [Lethenteron reissneri]
MCCGPSSRRAPKATYWMGNRCSCFSASGTAFLCSVIGCGRSCHCHSWKKKGRLCLKNRKIVNNADIRRCSPTWTQLVVVEPPCCTVLADNEQSRETQTKPTEILETDQFCINSKLILGKDGPDASSELSVGHSCDANMLNGLHLTEAKGNVNGSLDYVFEQERHVSCSRNSTLMTGVFVSPAECGSSPLLSDSQMLCICAETIKASEPHCDFQESDTLQGNSMERLLCNVDNTSAVGHLKSDEDAVEEDTNADAFLNEAPPLPIPLNLMQKCSRDLHYSECDISTKATETKCPTQEVASEQHAFEESCITKLLFQSHCNSSDGQHGELALFSIGNGVANQVGTDCLDLDFGCQDTLPTHAYLDRKCNKWATAPSCPVAMVQEDEMNERSSVAIPKQRDVSSDGSATHPDGGSAEQDCISTTHRDVKPVAEVTAEHVSHSSFYCNVEAAQSPDNASCMPVLSDENLLAAGGLRCEEVGCDASPVKAVHGDPLVKVTIEDRSCSEVGEQQLVVGYSGDSLQVSTDVGESVCIIPSAAAMTELPFSSESLINGDDGSLLHCGELALQFVSHKDCELLSSRRISLVLCSEPMQEDMCSVLNCDAVNYSSNGKLRGVTNLEGKIPKVPSDNILTSKADEINLCSLELSEELNADHETVCDGTVPANVLDSPNRTLYCDGQQLEADCLEHPENIPANFDTAQEYSVCSSSTSPNSVQWSDGDAGVVSDEKPHDDWKLKSAAAVANSSEETAKQWLEPVQHLQDDNYLNGSELHSIDASVTSQTINPVTRMPVSAETHVDQFVEQNQIDKYAATPSYEISGISSIKLSANSRKVGQPSRQHCAAYYHDTFSCESKEHNTDAACFEVPVFPEGSNTVIPMPTFDKATPTDSNDPHFSNMFKLFDTMPVGEASFPSIIQSTPEGQVIVEVSETEYIPAGGLAGDLASSLLQMSPMFYMAAGSPMGQSETITVPSGMHGPLAYSGSIPESGMWSWMYSNVPPLQVDAKINTAPNVATQLMVEGAVLNPNAASWKSPAPSADIAFAPGRAVNGDWPDPEPLPYSEVYSGSNGEEGEATFGASTEVEPVLPPEPLTPTSPTPQDEHIPEGKPYVVMESASGDGEAPEAEDGLQVPVVNGAGKEPPSLVGENPTCPLTGDVGQSETQTMKPEELKEILRKQLEYYFSRENLANDMYLVSQMDSDHYVPIWTIANFNQVKRLTADTDLIVEVLKSSPLVQVDEKGEKVRPNHKRCIVILREVPESTPIEEVESLFKSENCPRFVSCEFAHNDSWYVTFESDADAQQAYKYLREEAKTFLGKPIMARIKAKSMGITAFIPKNGQQPLEVGGFHQQQFQPAAVYMQPVHYSPAQQQQQQQPPYPFYSMLSQPWSSSLGYYDGTQLVTGTFPSTAFLSSFPATGHYKHMQALQHRPYTGRSRGGGKSQGRSHHSQHDKVIPDAVSFVPMNSVHLVDRPATNGAPRGGANAGQRRPTGSTVGSGVGGGSSSSSSITSGVSGGGSSYRPHAPEQPFLGSRTQPSDVPFVRRDVEVNGGDPALLASRGRKGFRGRRRRDDERTVKCPQPPVPLVPPESPRLELAASEFPPLPGASTSVREDSVPTRHENRLADVVRGIGKASQTGSTNGSTAVPPSALNKSKPTPMPVCSPEPTIPCPTPQATVSSTTETAGTCTDEPSESRAPAPTVTPGPAEVHATEPKKLSYAQICQRPPMPPTSQPVANGSAVAGTAGDMGDADRDTADDSREPEVASKPVEGPPRDQRKQFGISTHAHAVARKPLGVQNGMARPRAAMVAKETQ